MAANLPLRNSLALLRSFKLQFSVFNNRRSIIYGPKYFSCWQSKGELLVVPSGPWLRLDSSIVARPSSLGPAHQAFDDNDARDHRAREDGPRYHRYAEPLSVTGVFGKVRGEGHEAEDTLLRTGIPAARTAGIQIVYIGWGISEKELDVLPPAIFRGFGFSETEEDHGTGGKKELEADGGVGDDIGDVQLPDGSTVSAGRLLMRDQWNTRLHGPLQGDFDKSQTTNLPDVRFHKSRVSGFWGGTTPCIGYLKEKGITTLLFTGVNTDQCVLASLQDACSIGFDTILLKDGCGTSSPEYATKMVEFNCCLPAQGGGRGAVPGPVINTTSTVHENTSGENLTQLKERLSNGSN